MIPGLQIHMNSVRPVNQTAIRIIDRSDVYGRIAKDFSNW